MQPYRLLSVQHWWFSNCTLMKTVPSTVGAEKHRSYEIFRESRFKI